MKYSLFLLLLICSGINFAQKVIVQDFNRDSIMDTIATEYGIEFIDGASGLQYNFEKHFSRADFLDFVGIPDILMENKSLLDSLEHLLFSFPKSTLVPPELSWLLRAYREAIKGSKNKQYSMILNMPPRWQDWPPNPPKALYALASTDTLSIPHINYTDQNFKYGWLLYYGHNQLLRKAPNTYGMEEVISKEHFQVYKSSHGLTLRKGEKYTWIFHSDFSLTGGPGKLRWSSIKNVFLYKDHIILHHIAPIQALHKIFVISLENGTIGQVRLPDGFEFNSTDCFSVIFNPGQLQISSRSGDLCEREPGGEENKALSLDQLITELE